MSQRELQLLDRKMIASLSTPVAISSLATKADLLACWRNDGLAGVAAYLQAHPEIGADPNSLIAWLAELYWRQLLGEDPLDQDQFCDCFPHLKYELQRHFTVDAFLEKNADLTVALPSEPIWPQPGETMLGFTLLQELGHGTFGRVFLATEPAVGNRHVVVKVAKEGAREADMLGRLQHPNIVPVHSVQWERVSKLTAVCMPYLGNATLLSVLQCIAITSVRPQDGRIFLQVARENLATPLAVEKLPPPDPRLLRANFIDSVVHIALQLAEALAHAHARGVFHRDLKPSNVLLGLDGRPMLMDFNLADDVRLAARVEGGTIPYLSPEQRHVMSREKDAPPSSVRVDARSDIFSFGVILYELLGRARPFPFVSLKRDVKTKVMRLPPAIWTAPQPIQQRNPEVDGQLAAIVHRCLALHPDERPQSAAELAGMLRRYLSRPQRTRRWMKRHWRAMTAAAFLACGLGVATIIYWANLPPYAVRQLDKGWACYRQADYTSAIECFERASTADPNSPEAYYARGRAYIRLGDYPRAKESLYRAMQLKQDGRYYASHAYCCNLQGDHWLSIPSYRFAIEHGCNSAIVYNNLAYSHLRTKQDLHKAGPYLDKALELDPSLQQAYLNRIVFHVIQLQRTPREVPSIWLADADSALKLGPQNALLHCYIARLFAVAAKRHPERAALALEHIERAVSLGQNPRDLANDSSFEILAKEPRFLALTQLPTPSHPIDTSVYILDPEQD